MKNTLKIIVNLVRISLRLDSQSYIINKYKDLAMKIDIRENLDGFSNHKEMKNVLDTLKMKVFDNVQKYTIANDLILDVGCGSGRYLEMFENRKLIGLDSNNEILERVTKKYVPNAELYCVDLNDLNQMEKFTNSYVNKVNFIIVTSLLYHIPRSKIKNFFENLTLILKKDGIIFLHCPIANKFSERYGEINYIRYSTRELIKIINNNNLTIISEEIFQEHDVCFVLQK